MSRKCYTRCQNCRISYYSGSRHPQWKKENHNKICLWCNKIFDDVLGKGTIYCSGLCSGRAVSLQNKQQEKLKGPNNPAWLGGISNLPYPLGFNDELKHWIKKRVEDAKIW